MVVEDDAEMNELERQLLAVHGIESFPAHSGREAIELFENRQVDGVLLDVMLPEIDGFETCRRLRQLSSNPTMPIIMITAMSDPTVTDKGYAMGANALFPKPFSPDEVINKLQTLLADNM
jgi:two-component system response regulator VanR